MLALLLAAALAAPAAAQAPSAEEIARHTRRITEITGFAAKRPVPFAAITREEWKRSVDEEIRRRVKPEEIRAEELASKMLGLLPEDFDLRKAMVDLLSEQAAAVYDYRKKKMLFVEGGMAGFGGEMVVVHELAHALADQHFNLGKFIDRAPERDEAQTARMAVVEGQAMWVMLEAQMSRMGQSLRTDPAMLQAYSTGAASGAGGAFPAFDSAPLYLRQSLMFPYMAGVHFQQKAVERYGQRGFTEVMRRPPTTTREVLHPEVWLAGERPVRVALPEFEGGRGYRRLIEGSLGELDFQVLFTQYASEAEARRRAPAWRGGVFDVQERRKTRHAVLRWATEWESEEAARAVMALSRRVMEGKAPGVRFTRETEDELEGVNARGRFRIARKGTRVEGLEGLKPAE